MPHRRPELARARKAAGYTQEELAHVLRVDRTTVARWEAGITEPQPWLQPKLAKVLDLGPGELGPILGAGMVDEGQGEGNGSENARTLGARSAPASIEVVERPVDDGEADMRRRHLLKAAGLAAVGTVASSTFDLPPIPGAGKRAPWAAPIHETVLNPGLRMRSCANRTGSAAQESARQRIDEVMTKSLRSDYASLEASLPDLLGQVELRSLASPGDPSALRNLSDVYSVVGWTLIKADDPLGAWIAAQRAVDAAEEAEDSLRVAAATRCLAEVYMRNGNHEKAIRTALLATVCLDGSLTVHAQVSKVIRGAALLSAATAAARQGERREACTALQAASQCSDDLAGDHSPLATVFGPTNVAIHRVVISVELGDPDRALRHAERVDLARTPPIYAERRSRFLLDVARAQVDTADFDSALQTLLHAEQVSASEVRHHRITRQLLPHLMVHEKQGSGLRGLARRCNIAI